MESRRQERYGLILLCCLGATVAWGQRGQAIIARDGQTRAVIVVPAGWTNAVALPEGLPRQAGNLLEQRREVFRESFKDLACYLGRMSGTEIEIVEGLPDREKRVPIYIGGLSLRVSQDIHPRGHAGGPRRSRRGAGHRENHRRISARQADRRIIRPV